MAIINALSGSSTDVQNAINSAVGGSPDYRTGDTVLVPPGAVSWSTTVAVNKAITLQSHTTVNSTTGTANDQTIVLDDIPINPVTSSATIMAISANARVTGFSFRAGARGGVGENGAIQIGGAPQLTTVRFDNCHFTPLFQRQFMFAAGWVYACIDHNVYEFGLPTDKGQLILVFHDAWGGRSYGDGSFADLPYWGTDKAVYMEDNYVINRSAAQTIGGPDSYFGGRYVFRHNHCFNVTPNTHGTEGPYRSTRTIDIYDNDFHNDPSYNTDTFLGANQRVIYNMGQLRGGIALWHDNTWDGADKPTSGMILQIYRSIQYPVTGYLSANGTNPRDINDTEGNGTNVPGHSPHLYESGTVTSSSSGVLTDTSKTWTLNQWQGYELINTTTGASGIIYGSDAHSITFFVYESGLAFAAGNTYSIYRLLIAADQPGRGQSDLITRDGNNFPTAVWNNGVLDPCYSWNNKYTPDGSDVNLGSTLNQVYPNGVGAIQSGRDYLNGTVKPGYSKFQYPHPLVSGASIPPPFITSLLNASGTVGVLFSYQISASNGPTSFTATGLPSGLVVNTSTGVISGTPTVDNVYLVPISATNASGTGTATLSINIHLPVVIGNPPVLTSPRSASGVVNQFFSYQISATNSPTTYSASPLPAGLNVNTGTGLISGTPTGAATTSVTIGATNANGTATGLLSIVIAAAPPTSVGKRPKGWKRLMNRRHQ